MSRAKDSEEFVLDHKLVWTGWKNNPKFLLDQRQKELKHQEKEKGQMMSERAETGVENQGESQAERPPVKHPRKGKYLTSKQAAERLGVTHTTVTTMIKRGQLTNMWAAPEGKTYLRQQIALDAGEVRQFAKTYKNRSLPGMLRKMRGEENGKVEARGVKAGTKRGAYKKQPKAEAGAAPTAERKVYLISEDSPVQGFTSQIKAMRAEMAEVKAQVEGLSGMVEDAIKGIQSLVKLWS